VNECKATQKEENRNQRNVEGKKMEKHKEKEKDIYSEGKRERDIKRDIERV